MKRLCLVIALCLSGCSNTVTKLDLSSQKEDILDTTIVFVEKKLPIAVEGYNTSSISGDVLTRAMGGAILGVKHAFDEDRMLDICASCVDFDFNKPIRESFLETFQTLDWMGNQNFCVVGNYKKAKQEIQKRQIQLTIATPCKSLRQREKCCAGEAKLRHFLGLVLIFCRQSARYAQE